MEMELWAVNLSGERMTLCFHQPLRLDSTGMVVCQDGWLRKGFLAIDIKIYL